MTEHLYRKKIFCLSFTVISTRFYMHTQNKSSTSVLKYGSLIKSTRTPAFLCNSQRYITIYGLQCCNNHERVTCLCINLCAFSELKCQDFESSLKKKTFVTIIESSNFGFSRSLKSFHKISGAIGTFCLFDFAKFPEISWGVFYKEFEIISFVDRDMYEFSVSRFKYDGFCFVVDQW